jgi:hypothetical protein
MDLKAVIDDQDNVAINLTANVKDILEREFRPSLKGFGRQHRARRRPPFLCIWLDD